MMDAKGQAFEDDALQALLAEREAKGLQVPVVLRILFCLFGLAQIPIIAPAFAATPFGIAAFFASFLLAIAANVVFLVLLRRRQAVALVGMAGACLDVALFFTESWAFDYVRGSIGLPPGSVTVPLTVWLPLSKVPLSMASDSSGPSTPSTRSLIGPLTAPAGTRVATMPRASSLTVPVPATKPPLPLLNSTSTVVPAVFTPIS